MILRRFFKPKWQHSDPQVRREALLAVGSLEGAKVLATVAAGDEVAELRRLAVERLMDLDLLRRLGESDVDAGVREQAMQRYCSLLAHDDAGELSLELRVREIDRLQDARVLEYVAAHGREAELRIAALRKGPTERLLGELAVGDSEPRVRLAAVECIRTPDVLESVAKQARKRDKRVSRIARDKLAQALAEAERPLRLRRQAETLCVAMEALLSEGCLEVLRDARAQLQVQWRALSSVAGLDEGLASRWRDAEGQVATRLESLEAEAAERDSEARLLAPLRERKLELCATLEDLAADLRGRSELDAIEEQTVDSILNMTESAFGEIPPLSEAEEQALEERFRRLLEQVQCRRHILIRQAALTAALEGLCARAEALADAAELPSGERAARLRARWGELAVAGRFGAALEERWHTAGEQLDRRLREQQQMQRQALDELPNVLAALEEALEQGQSQRATELETQARQALEQIGPELRRRADPLRARLRRLAPRRRELSDWRRWADTQEKERLCEEMERLAEQLEELPVEAIAARVRAARDAWKALGPTDPGTGKILWQRFDAACNRAYGPCQEKFAAQARLREQHLAEKTETCAELEALVVGAEWSELGPREISRALDAAWTRWRELGPVPLREARRLQRRFAVARAPLEQRLAAERERSEQHKEALAQRVEALAQLEDLAQAIRQTKQAQAEWRSVGPTSRKSDRELWLRFRAACDMVFARREAARAAWDSELVDNQARREALCDALDALAARPAEAIPADADAQLRRATAEWAAAGEPPAAAAQGLQRRFRDACAAVTDRLRVTRIAALRGGLELLRQKAALCAEAEATAGVLTDVACVAQLRERWESLSALDEETETAIRARFAAALAGAADRDLDKWRHQREELCLRMEILAGIESPPEASEARLAYQVALLAQAMGQGRAAQPEQQAALAEALAIQRAWLLAGPAPESLAAALEQRFHRADDAFWRRNTA